MRITPQQVAKVLRGHVTALPRIAKQAALVSAHRTVGALKKVSPVDTGGFRAAWQVKNSQLATVENRHPVAGVIERGARPHGVNEEGRAAILAWAIRKGLDNPERAVGAIIRKLERQGQKGLFLLEKQIPDSVRWMQAELERLLAEQGKKAAE